MKKYLLFLTTVFHAISNAQNMVPNHSFEDYLSCPTSTGQFNLATPWYTPSNTGAATPDLYNACNTTIAGVPSNAVGFQAAHTGVGYAGFYTYGASSCREYIQIQLIAPMVAGSVYDLEMYVSPGENAGIAVDAVGIYISMDSIIGSGTYDPLPYVPQISNPTGSIISDTAAWTIVSGSYTASGGEEYITIGNFLNDLSTNTIMFNSAGWNRGYYLVDDVSVTLASSAAIGEQNDATILRIFPNPFSNQTTFQTARPLNNASLKIYNSVGQLVRQLDGIQGSSFHVDRTDLSAGVYFIQLTEDKENIAIQKLVIND